ALERFPGGGAERDMASRRATKGTLTAVSKTEESVPNPLRGNKDWDGVKSCRRRRRQHHLCGATGTTQDSGGGRTGGCCRSGRQGIRGRRIYRAGGGGRLRQTGEPKMKLAVRPCPCWERNHQRTCPGTPRPEPRKASSTRPDQLPQEDWRLESENSPWRRRASSRAQKYKPRVKESVIGKLSAIGELALRLEESRSNYVAELEREKARRAREMEAAEKRITKITSENLDRILNVESKIEKMMVEVTSTRTILGHFDVPEKLEAIRKAVETRPAPRPQNYAEAAARPKPLAAAAPKIPGPEVRSGATLL
ncbi:hypothetical protein EVAR_57852_1, partial [Eumeta japonica]